jgi:hypothetical protein
MTRDEIITRLLDGAAADIWYDAFEHGDDEVGEQIVAVKKAMREAAKLLQSITTDHVQEKGQEQ